jgi:hypothetical protein
LIGGNAEYSETIAMACDMEFHQVCIEDGEGKNTYAHTEYQLEVQVKLRRVESGNYLKEVDGVCMAGCSPLRAPGCLEHFGLRRRKKLTL